MEYIGFALMSVLFFSAAYSHMKYSNTMEEFAGQSGFPVPYVAGRVTGISLLVIGILILLGNVIGFWLAAGFLAITGVFFHTNLKDPANMKHFALLGACLAFIGTL